MVSSAFTSLITSVDPSLIFTVIHAQDYIALGLLKALDVASVPLVSFSFILEEVEKVLEAVVFEVSADGYRWVSWPASLAATRRTRAGPD